MTTTTKSAKVSLKPIEVPKALQEGEKCIKWDEVRIKNFKRTRFINLTLALQVLICKVKILQAKFKKMTLK